MNRPAAKILMAGALLLALGIWAWDSRGYSQPAAVPGKPVETRPPEKADDRPAFTGQTRAPFEPGPAFHVSVLTDRLEEPWSLAFLPGGNLLVTEKPGVMRILDSHGQLSEPLAGVPRVRAIGQVGLLDVALDPDFAANHRLFFSYSEPVGLADSTIAVARARLEGHRLTDLRVIFRARPALFAWSHSSNSGGRIAIGPDGNLFVTIGDRSGSPPWDRAQKLDTDLGKIIRITPDGAPAPGNPFIGRPGALPEIYSYGHRSEEGLAFDGQGRLWENEHGPRGGDELNLIEPGKNYGWPLVTHGVDYPGDPIGEGKTAMPGTVQPRYYWDPVIAPSGLAFYTGDLFPQWKNSVFVGGLRGMLLDRLTLSGDKVVSEEPLLLDQHARIRDVRMGPDGALYVLSDEGRLYKLTPK